MTTENRHHILVMSSTTGRLAGLLTERDFLTKLPLARGAARATAVTELMTPSYDLILGSEMAKIMPLLPLGVSALVGGIAMLLYIVGAYAEGV